MTQSFIVKKFWCPPQLVWGALKAVGPSSEAVKSINGQGAESSQGGTQATRALSERGASLLNALAGWETTADPEAAKDAELERECIAAGVEYHPV